MRRCASAVSVFVVLLVASLLPGLSLAMAQVGATPGVLRVNWGDPIPDTLDPQLSHRGQWGISGGVDYEGLTRLDEELMPVPGAAESWQFSEDGKTLTFHLRDGLVFSDGVRIFAEHFVYGAQRLCSPELDSASASLLFDVVGCEELYTNFDGATGTAAKANLGVRALNERTVEYRFDRSAPYFLVSAARWAAIPLREELIAAGGPEWWADPATRVGNGPFRLVAYERAEPNQRLVYARNDRYWDGPTALDRLEFYFDDLQDYSATMAAYGSDKYDIQRFASWFGQGRLRGKGRGPRAGPRRNSPVLPGVPMKAYSTDLRERILRAVDAGLSKRQAARVFGVSRSTIKRYAQQRRATGSLVPQRRPSGPPPRIGPAQHPALRAQLAAAPDATLAAHCATWEREQGMAVSVATLQRAIARLKWTRKKRRSPPASGTRPSGPPGTTPSPPATRAASSSSTRPGPIGR